MKIIISKEGIEYGELKLHKQVNDRKTFLSLEKVDVDWNKSDFEIAKEMKGLLIVDKTKEFIIYNDPFSSIPIFFSKTIKDNIVLTSDFSLHKECHLTVNVDECGFWESTLYGESLGDRTIFKEIKQMTSASMLVINKESLSYSQDYYWDFNIQKSNKLKSLDECVEKLDKILDDIFSRISEPSYLMGISGGLDSRLTLLLLKNNIDISKVELFTFGYNSKILEYEIAQKVCSELGYKKPCFHKLVHRHYDEFDELAQNTASQVGISHTHMYSYLAGRENKDNVLISNYYSDAIFGYDAKKYKTKKDIKQTSYYRILESSSFIPEEIRTEIIEDIEIISGRYPEDANYSNLEEYLYITERSPKFHVQMTYNFNKFCKVLMPYANIDLLEYMISVPLEYRYEKKLESMLLCKSQLNIEDISSRKFIKADKNDNYWGSSKVVNFLKFYSFRFTNLLNIFLRIATNGKFLILNKSLTEDHQTIMYVNYKSELKDAVKYFVEANILNDDQYKILSKIPRRVYGVSFRFQLLSSYRVIKKFNFTRDYKLLNER